MALIGNIEAFVPGEDFEAYQERLLSFYELNGVKEETKKISLLVVLIGAETYGILKNCFFQRN